MAGLFKLRKARNADLKLINAYAAAEGMDEIKSIKDIRVAANADDQCVGFLRLTRRGGVAYVNPMATYSAWRGYGIGRALIEDALRREGELRLVSRGGSIEFYRKMGFRDAAWEDIHADVASDCDGCPMREECGPLPMLMILREGQKE